MQNPTIGIPGAAQKFLKSPGTFLINIVANGFGSDANYEVLSGITFGDPLVRLVNGVSLNVALESEITYRATIAASTANSASVSVGIGSASAVDIINDSSATNNCSSGARIGGSVSRYYSLDSGDSFRFRLRADSNGGIGRTVCVLTGRHVITALARCDDVVIDDSFNFGNFAPYTVDVRQL